MLEHRGGDRRKLCNTSGADYRASGLGEKLNELDDHAFFELLTGNGNLIKRPFMLGVGVGLTGFKEDEWAAALAG